jgi:hypothetical protein
LTTNPVYGRFLKHRVTSLTLPEHLSSSIYCYCLRKRLYTGIEEEVCRWYVTKRWPKYTMLLVGIYYIIRRVWRCQRGNQNPNGMFESMKQLLLCHFLLKYLYQGRKVSCHLHVLLGGINVAPVSAILLLYFGTFLTVWN